jgi:hypothetical protein
VARYRKKPVFVEAEPYRDGLEDGFEEYRSATCHVVPIPEELISLAFGWVLPADNGDWVVRLPYLEGDGMSRRYIRRGDYIVTETDGNRYPCKPVHFQATYEPIEEKIDAHD